MHTPGEVSPHIADIKWGRGGGGREIEEERSREQMRGAYPTRFLVMPIRQAWCCEYIYLT